MSGTIGKNIRARRLELGMTQKELAEKLGYKSCQAITKIETGENDIPLSKVEAFAEALETDKRTILGWEDEKPRYTTMSRGGNLAKLQTVIDDFDEDELEQLFRIAEALKIRK